MLAQGGIGLNEWRLIWFSLIWEVPCMELGFQIAAYGVLFPLYSHRRVCKSGSNALHVSRAACSWASVVWVPRLCLFR